MPVEPLRGVVAGSKQWTPLLHSIYINAPIAPFAAGQFGRIGLQIDDKIVLRPYSFVNAPAQTPLEFYYIVVEGGPLSARLPKLRAGDEIFINEKANGFLVLGEVPQAEQLWMLSTGTALGPFLSILKTDEAWGKFKEFVLVHAVRTQEELTYRETIDELLERANGRLRYIPFVSREKTDFALPGRVPQALQNGALARAANLEFAPGRSQFMLCGNPQMVKDTTEALKGFGFERNRRRAPGHITAENYW
jgi:ferredoxin--NADP+ reductase